MAKPIVNVAGVEREMNDEEYAQWQLDQENEAKRLAKEVEAENKRKELLDKLGLTEEEARLLLG